ncbi:conserved hypothetical protein [Ricinus communis]|uniref:Uncharacterized protein n=1 Tax=Ricinus communis TaxID=3988 RepID=B9RPK1_RICCO|nr:conserved hypothetical protein [Ricinus communis]
MMINISYINIPPRMELNRRWGGRAANDNGAGGGGNDNSGDSCNPHPRPPIAQPSVPHLGRSCPSVPRLKGVDPSHPLILTTH